MRLPFVDSKNPTNIETAAELMRLPYVDWNESASLKRQPN
jgi:hypothetical protein